jgi:hypothetical protein
MRQKGVLLIPGLVAYREFLSAICVSAVDFFCFRRILACSVSAKLRPAGFRGWGGEKLS